MRHHKIASHHSERTWIHFPWVASQGRSNHGTSSHESGELRLLDLHLQLRKDSTGSACLFHSRMKVHGGRSQARALQLSSSPYGLKRHRGRFVQTQIHLRSIRSENLQTWQASRAPPTNTTDCVRLQLMDDCDRLDLVNAKCKGCKEMLQRIFHCEMAIWLCGRLKCGIGPKVGHCEVMLDSTYLFHSHWLPQYICPVR